MDDRVITDFAERLVPEAFHRSHSADRVDVVDTRAVGDGAFDRWVDERLAEAAVDRYAWGGRPVLYVVVESADGTRWRWDESPCCRPAWLADRVRDESRDLVEPWVFGAVLEWPDELWGYEDPETGDVVELARPITPDVEWPVTWYAEARGRGVADVRAGRVRVGRGDRIVLREPLPPRRGVPAAFHRVLYGHADRKRYPLRRGRR